MDKVQVYFVELAVPQKARYVCDIVEKFYRDGQKVAIFTKEKKDALQLDQQLWVWKPESFIPHRMVDEQAASDEEPVLITSSPDNLPQAEALIQFDPIPAERMSGFKYVIDFAETYRKDKLHASRERFKQIRDAGKYELEFVKLGSFLALEL